MKCIKCNYESESFKVRGYYNEKVEMQCPECGARSVNHIDTEAEESIKVKKLRDIASFERRKANVVVQKHNMLESLIDGIFSVVSSYKFTNEKKYVKPKQNSSVGIIQLSDVHFNELIDLAHNKYDFTVASARLYKLADEAKKYFASKDIDSVVVVCTGDMMNSDRRADEVMCAATNRSVAAVIASDILSKFINDLSDEFASVDVHYVVGNESRVGETLTFSKAVAFDNYDFVIMQLVKARVSGLCNVRVHDPLDPNEILIRIGNFNILALHGYNIKSSGTTTNIHQIVGKYASNGVIINYIMFGHIHSSYISNFFARSGSLCGANAYSDVYLNLTSRASQNIYTVDVVDNSINGIVIDLQNTDGALYEFDDLEDKYNPKSMTKAKKALKRGV